MDPVEQIFGLVLKGGKGVGPAPKDLGRVACVCKAWNAVAETCFRS